MRFRALCAALLLVPSCCFENVANFHPPDIRASKTCELYSALLYCERGFIRMDSANYGRADHATCSEGRPPQQLANAQCFLPSTLAVMSQRCDGTKQCEVTATNDVFSDPCVGTYKYLDIKYVCSPSKRSVTCEGGTAELDCGDKAIRIENANYGRRDRYLCSSGRPADQLTNVQCVLSGTLGLLRKRCDGNTQCTVMATNYVFSDPCVGTYKYLDVTYTCSP
ncbi:L-rhamnose-binding lectin CSL3-like isoform X2 [Lepisosteus oculatus]